MTDQPLDKPQDDDAITSEADEFESAFEEYSKSATADRDEYHVDRDAKPDEPEGEEEPEADEGDEQNEEEDAPDDLSARLKQLEEENQRLKHSDASQRGRLGAYQRQINELQRKQQELESAKSTNPSGESRDEDQQRQDMAESMGVDDWKEFAEDFPDMARAFEARLKADQQRQAQLEQQINELRSAVQPIQQQAHEQQLQSEYARLEDRHNDWREVVNAPEFQTWLQSQNPTIQGLAESDSADDASALLDFYKGMNGGGADNSRAQQHDKRQSRLANAQTVSRRGAGQRSGAPDDFDAAFEHYAAKRR